MNNKIKQALVRYANMTAQCVKYKWSSDFQAEELKENFDQLQKTINNEKPNFFEMTESELKEYGFVKFDNKSNLMLIPLYLMDCFEKGTELTCIDGTKKIVGKDYISDDVRFGCIAYGIYCKEVQEDENES